MTFTVSLKTLVWFTIKTVVIVGVIMAWSLVLFRSAYVAGYTDYYEAVLEAMESSEATSV